MGNNEMFLKNRRLFPFIVCVFAFTSLFLLCACGKKGDPTLKSYEKPEPPSQLTAIHRESEIILSWKFPKSKEPSIKGFHLLKSTGGDFEELTSLNNDQRSYTDTRFEIGGDYHYKIVAQNLKGVLSKDSNILVIRPATLPAPPKNLSFIVTYDVLMLTWASAGEGLLYNVYKSDKPGDYSLTPVNREPLKELSLKDVFTVSKSVFYTIRSVSGSLIRDEGPASVELIMNPEEFVPPSPENLQAVPTQSNVHLVWKESAATWVRGYRIYRETNTQEGFIVLGETQTPSFLDSGKPDTKRNYRVTALGPAKEGPPAEIRDIVYTEPR
jgi:fibronectin type 3 domain-containing protein